MFYTPPKKSLKMFIPLSKYKISLKDLVQGAKEWTIQRKGRFIRIIHEEGFDPDYQEHLIEGYLREERIATYFFADTPEGGTEENYEIDMTEIDYY